MTRVMPLSEMIKQDARRCMRAMDRAGDDASIAVAGELHRFDVENFMASVGRMAIAGKSYTAILNGEIAYDLAVLGMDMRPDLADWWISKPFRIVAGERRGSVDERWERWKKVQR